MTSTFTLERTEDVSGVSGTGTVADGVEFPDGTVVVRWRDRGHGHQSTVLWESIEAVLEVHGHEGRTTVRWDSGDPRELDESRLPLTVRMGMAGAPIGRARNDDGRLTVVITDATASAVMRGSALTASVSLDDPRRLQPEGTGPVSTCMAHGLTLAQHHGKGCARPSEDCQCGYFASTGMHWDTCPGRRIEPLVSPLVPTAGFSDEDEEQGA